MINDASAVLPPTVYRYPRAKPLGVLLVSALFVAVGVLMVVTGDAVMPGVAGILFFGLCGAAVLNQWIQWAPNWCWTPTGWRAASWAESAGRRSGRCGAESRATCGWSN
ncbi:hypothetical protein [Kitasatospora sp. NPDC059673]|uniref:hypothetical protein n=1 Tax=Kitasatospora sp. NPDC059673 TaxID=3346901 RepID=UPI00369E304F